MSTPDPARDGATPAPSVSTAPAAAGDPAPTDVAPGSRWWSNVPRHLGRARTSTVVLAVLFVGLFFLYLNVRPPAPGAPPETPAPDTSVVEEPVPTGTTEPTEPTEPAEPTEPTETEPTTTTTTPSRPTTSPPTSTSPSTAPTTTGSPTTEPGPDGDEDGTTEAPPGEPTVTGEPTG